MKYNNEGKFLKKSNSQIENTPIVIVTYGESRRLHWRRMKRIIKFNGKYEWILDTSWSETMEMNNEYFLIINPKDEKPHYYCNGETTVKYQHGNVTFTGNTISFALVFRVVSEYCMYAKQTNCMINCHTNDVKENNKINIRNSLYLSFDKEQYHKDMKNIFSKCLN